MRKLTFGAALAASAFVLPAAAPAQQLPAAVVAVIDQGRIVETCTACVTANQQLQAQLQQLQQRAQQLGQPLQTEAQSIQTAVQGAQGQPDAALQQRIQTFQGQQEAAQREIAQRQEQIQRNAAYVRQQIGQRLEPIIVQVMQQRGANLAVDRGVTLAISPAVDITDAVLASLNQQLTTLNINAPAPQQPAEPQQQRPQGR